MFRPINPHLALRKTILPITVRFSYIAHSFLDQIDNFPPFLDGDESGGEDHRDDGDGDGNTVDYYDYPDYLLQEEIFPSCRARNETKCDSLGDRSVFDEQLPEVKDLFSPPPFQWWLGHGYLGHFSWDKCGLSAICNNTSESNSHIDPSKLALVNLWYRLGGQVYVYRTTHGREYYCFRYLLDKAVEEFNLRRESGVATAVEQKYLQYAL
jgi:hypothetical protein